MKKGLLALTFGVFGFGLSESIIIGIISYIARGLEISIPKTGLFISMYAIGICMGALLLIRYIRIKPVKKILLLLAGTFLFGNLLTACSVNYEMMLLSRFISGLPHGAFVGIGMVAAGKLAGKERKPEAMVVLLSGLVIANLAGVPIGTFIGDILSWRLTFFLIACWGAFVYYYIWRWVPNLNGVNAFSLSKELSFLRSPHTWLSFIAVVLGGVGFYSTYSFMNPLLTDISGFPEGCMTAIMVLTGFSMCGGGFLGYHLANRYKTGYVSPTLQLLLALCLLFISFYGANPYGAVFLTCISCMCMFAFASSLLVKFVQYAKRLIFGIIIFQIAFSLGMALGALGGSSLLGEEKGYELIALYGFILVFLSIVITWLSIPRQPRK